MEKPWILNGVIDSKENNTIASVHAEFCSVSVCVRRVSVHFKGLIESNEVKGEPTECYNNHA